MPPHDMPAAEMSVDHVLVRRLLKAQFPEWAHHPLELLANGWDNVIFRLGDDLVVRLPRRRLAAALVAHEQRWLPELAARLPLPIPAPIGAGRAAFGYPWSWSVCPWLPGAVATQTPPDDPFDAARVLGRFVAALHTNAPLDAPLNPYRGVPLSDRDEVTCERIDQLSDSIDSAAVVERWEACTAVPRWNGPPLWLHGDLHPANVLVHLGRISAVIDFGDITSGDPATDLSSAWMFFPVEARATFREAYGPVDDDTWERAKGWALTLALAYLANSADNPVFARLGHQVLDAVLADS